MMEGDPLNESRMGNFPLNDKLNSFRLGEKAEKNEKLSELDEEKNKNKEKMKESFVVSHYKKPDEALEEIEKIKDELKIELKEEQEFEAKILIEQKEKDVEIEFQVEDEEGFFEFYCLLKKKLMFF